MADTPASDPPARTMTYEEWVAAGRPGLPADQQEVAARFDDLDRRGRRTAEALDLLADNAAEALRAAPSARCALGAGLDPAADLPESAYPRAPFVPAPAGFRVGTPLIPGSVVDREWQHGSCLAIAEGAPGWDQDFGDRASPAMLAVQALRRLHDEYKTGELRALRAMEEERQAKFAAEAERDLLVQGRKDHEAEYAALLAQRDALVDQEARLRAAADMRTATGRPGGRRDGETLLQYVERAGASLEADADPLRRRLGAAVDDLTARGEELVVALGKEQGARREAEGRARNLNEQVEEVLSLKRWAEAAGRRGSDNSRAVGNWALKLLAENAAEALTGEKDYAEFRMESRGGAFAVTLQRLESGARTPHDLRVEAEAQAAAMRGALVEAERALEQLRSALEDADGRVDSAGTTAVGRAALLRGGKTADLIRAAVVTEAGRDFLASFGRGLQVIQRIAAKGCQVPALNTGKSCRERDPADAPPEQWCAGCLAAAALA